MSGQALMPRMMRSCPESHCRKDDAIRDSRIASSSQLEFLLGEACVRGGDDGQQSTTAGSGQRHDWKVWLEKLVPHAPPPRCYT
jgi:hypothetical protein